MTEDVQTATTLLSDLSLPYFFSRRSTGRTLRFYRNNLGSNPSERTMKNEIGNVYGRYTVIKEGESRRQPSGAKIRYLLCECECGTIKEVRATTLRQRRDNISCGCLNKENQIKRLSTHGKASYNNKLYRTWRNMKARCYNPNTPKYHIYGGKGIEVCKEWKDDYQAFEDWSYANGFYDQPKDTPYKDTLSIDRDKSNLNYSPTNCQWLTISDNSIKGIKSRYYGFNN